MDFQVSQKKLVIKTDIDTRIPNRVFTDQKRFKQVLFNLIGNAIKFTFQGSITVRAVFKTPYLIVSVEDTGVGIPEEEMGKLF